MHARATCCHQACDNFLHALAWLPTAYADEDIWTMITIGAVHVKVAVILADLTAMHCSALCTCWSLMYPTANVHMVFWGASQSAWQPLKNTLKAYFSSMISFQFVCAWLLQSSQAHVSGWYTAEAMRSRPLIHLVQRTREHLPMHNIPAAGPPSWSGGCPAARDVVCAGSPWYSQ